MSSEVSREPKRVLVIRDPYGKVGLKYQNWIGQLSESLQQECLGKGWGTLQNLGVCFIAYTAYFEVMSMTTVCHCRDDYIPSCLQLTHLFEPRRITFKAKGVSNNDPQVCYLTLSEPNHRLWGLKQDIGLYFEKKITVEMPANENWEILNPVIPDEKQGDEFYCWQFNFQPNETYTVRIEKNDPMQCQKEGSDWVKKPQHALWTTGVVIYAPWVVEIQEE